MNILIINNKPLTLIGIEGIIQKLYPDAETFKSDTILNGATLLKNERMDLIILDYDSTNEHVLSNIKKVKNTRPDIPILVVSAHDEKIYAIPFMNAGVSGYLSHSVSLEEFGKAISTLMSGKKYVSDTVRQIVLANVVGKTVWTFNPLDTLTSKERKIADLFSEGKTQQQIAQFIDLKQTSVAAHRRRIMNKLGVKSIEELTEKTALLK